MAGLLLYVDSTCSRAPSTKGCFLAQNVHLSTSTKFPYKKLQDLNGKAEYHDTVSIDFYTEVISWTPGKTCSQGNFRAERVRGSCDKISFWGEFGPEAKGCVALETVWHPWSSLDLTGNTSLPHGLSQGGLMIIHYQWTCGHVIVNTSKAVLKVERHLATVTYTVVTERETEGIHCLTVVACFSYTNQGQGCLFKLASIFQVV